MSALFADLLARFSGDSFHRLSAAQVAEKAASLTTERLRELRQAEDRGPDLRARGEQARAEDRAEAVAKALEAADRGERAEVDITTPGPRVLAHVERVKALAGEYGLPQGASAGQVLEAIHYRLTAIDAELKRRYAGPEGEPKGAVALRSEINAALVGTWGPRKALKDAREKLNTLGVALVESEVMAAHAELQVAEGKVAALRKRLADEYGLS